MNMILGGERYDAADFDRAGALIHAQATHGLDSGEAADIDPPRRGETGESTCA